MQDRRELGDPAAGGAAVLPQPQRGPVAPGPQHDSAGGPAAIAPFSVPLPLPRTLLPVRRAADTDFYAITACRGTAEFVPGTTAGVLTYGGSFCGPTIRARTGRRVVVAHTNRLDTATALHLYGGHGLSGSAGFPTDLVEPGHTRFYHYPNNQPAATLWYHDHAHLLAAEHVYRGMSGLYLLEDPAEARLGLPSGRYDIPIMLRDGCLSAAGDLVWAPGDAAGRGTVLVNGRPWPYLEVAARRYRFRICNSANLRTFTLRLGQADPVTQIASDRSLLPRPVPVRSLRLSPAERADVVIDFSRYRLGTRLVLADAAAGPVLRFDVTRVAPDNSRLPDTFGPAPALPTATVTRRVELAIDARAGTFLLNGRSFDPGRVDVTALRGSTEIWAVHNAGPAPVPLNLHLGPAHVTVLSRDGAPPPATEAGWKDTVPLAPGERVRLLATFSGYPGRYTFGCRLLDHTPALTGRLDLVA